MTVESLTPVEATLAGPLQHRARMSRDASLAFTDPVAEQLVTELGIDDGAVPDAPWLAEIVTRRAQIIDDLVKGLVEREPAMLLVNIGAGLCTRKFRLPAPQEPWVDVDTPSVIGLRRRLLLDKPPRSRFIAGKLEDDGWLRYLPWRPGEPVTFVAEGVLGYLPEREVRLFFERVAEGCPGANLVFDTWVPRMAERLDDDRRQKGSSARMRWTPKEPTVVRTWHRHLLVGSVQTMGPGTSVVHARARR